MQLHTVELPDGIEWLDEWDTSGYLQAPTLRRLDGGLAIYPQVLSAGRPITLEAGEDQPLTRAVANALWALAITPGGLYTLTMPLRGQVFTVAFRHDVQPLELTNLFDYADPDDTDYVIGRIHLMTAT